MVSLNAIKNKMDQEKNAFDQLVRPALNLISFININEGDVAEIRKLFGKPLNTVTADEVKQVYPSLDSPDEIETMLVILSIYESIIQVVKPMKETIPNDLENV